MNVGDYSAPKSSACVWNGMVYVGTDDGRIICNWLDNGTLVWEVQAETGPKGIHSSPAVHDGKVIIGVYGGRWNDTSGYTRGDLICLDAYDGSEIWSSYRSPGTANINAVGASCIIDAGRNRAYVGIEYGSGINLGAFAAIDLDSGREIYRYQTGDFIHSTPAADLERGIGVIGSNDDSVYAVDLENGSLLWSYKTGLDVKCSPAIDVERGIAVVGSFDGAVYAFDIETGARKWKHQTMEPIYSSPAIWGDEGLVYIGSYDMLLYALDINSGRIVWTFPALNPILSSPSVSSNGILVAGCHGGEVWGIDARTGVELWCYNTRGKITASPAIHDEKVLISSNDGKLYVLEQGDGDGVLDDVGFFAITGALIAAGVGVLLYQEKASKSKEG